MKGIEGKQKPQRHCPDGGERHGNSSAEPKGVREVLGAVILGKPVRKYTAAGDAHAEESFPEAWDRRSPGPATSAILAWARFDLSREILGGYWETRAA